MSATHILTWGEGVERINSQLGKLNFMAGNNSEQLVADFRILLAFICGNFSLPFSA